jgi:protein-S-isoprenylcysteine O-methyltransferase Ste14
MLALVVGHIAFYAILLFGGAGTLDWPAGWLFLAFYGGHLALTDVRLAQLDPDLAQERRTPGKATRPAPWDRRFLTVSAVLGPVWMVFMAFDAVRFGWSRLPILVALPGAALMVLGTCFSYAGLRANRFASVLVRLQPDRGQHVIDQGMYAKVRHPIYLGAFLIALGAPLILGSAWGLIGSAVLIILTSRRAVLEERFLADQLPGYRAYLARVRWRVLPGLF